MRLALDKNVSVGDLIQIVVIACSIVYTYAVWGTKITEHEKRLNGPPPYEQRIGAVEQALRDKGVNIEADGN